MVVSPSTGPMRILDSGQSFHRELWVFAKTLQILFDFNDYFFSLFCLCKRQCRIWIMSMLKFYHLSYELCFPTGFYYKATQRDCCNKEECTDLYYQKFKVSDLNFKGQRYSIDSIPSSSSVSPCSYLCVCCNCQCL